MPRRCLLLLLFIVGAVIARSSSNDDDDDDSWHWTSESSWTDESGSGSGDSGSEGGIVFPNKKQVGKCRSSFLSSLSLCLSALTGRLGLKIHHSYIEKL